MAITAAKLLVQVDADTSKAQGGLKNLEGGLNRLKGIGTQIGSVFAGVLSANVVSSAVSGLRNLASQGLQAYVAYERLGASLTALTAREMVNTGAAKNLSAAYGAAGPKVESLLKWIQQLAIQSPFKQDDVAQAFRMAQAYGFTTDEAQRLTTALINFSSATGQSGESMQRIALALGQIQAKGKLAGQEVLQLVNAGLSVDQILAEAFGKSTAEIVEMREQGLIPADQAIQAIVRSLEEDFGGAAERQADTFAGLVSSLEDIKDVGLREFFAGTFEALRPMLKGLTEAFTSGKLQEDIRKMGDAFGKFVKGAVEDAQNLIKWWGDLDGTTQKLIITLGGLVILGPKIANTVTAISGIVSGIAALKPVIATIASIGAAAVGAISAPVLIIGGMLAVATAGILAFGDGMRVTQAEAYNTAREVEELSGISNEAARKWGILADAMDKPIPEWDWRHYVNGVDEATEAAKRKAEADAKLREEELELAQAAETFANAQKTALQAGLSGTLTKALEDYKQTLADLAPEHEDLTARLEYLNVAGWIPSAESVEKLTAELLKKNDEMTKGEAAEQAQIMLLASHKSQLDEVRTALGENEAAQAAARAEMERTTAELIYQQAAAGLDAQASLNLARAMGLISEQDYALSTVVQNLRLAYDANADGAISAAEGANQYAESVKQAQEAAQALIDKNLPINIQNIATALNDLNGVEQYDPTELIPDADSFTAADTAILNFKEGAVTNFGEVTTQAEQTAANTKAAFETTDWNSLGATSAGEIATGFTTASAGANGLLKATENLIVKVKKLWQDATWPGIGQVIAEGIAKGIEQNVGKVTSAVSGAVGSALSAGRRAAQAESPSKLFADMLGRPISEGIGVGILQAAPIPIAATQAVIGATSQVTNQNYQNVSIAANVDRGIDMYELAITVANMLKG